MKVPACKISTLSSSSNDQRTCLCVSSERTWLSSLVLLAEYGSVNVSTSDKRVRGHRLHVDGEQMELLSRTDKKNTPGKPQCHNKPKIIYIKDV